jgi:RNA recognition motif-containing protein
MGTRLYVGNLPYSADEDSIKAFFEGGGGRHVTQVKIVTDRDTGRPRGFAFVEMNDENQARSAIEELNGRDFGGRTIVVNEAREPQRGGGGGGRGGRGGPYAGGRGGRGGGRGYGDQYDE